MDTGTTTPKIHLEMEPVKKSTDQLCESIVNQKGFKELFSKIDAFVTDEKLKYDYSTLNDQIALLQQKQQAGVEIKEEEIVEFEKLREEFMANSIATNFLEAQAEFQQVQDRINQIITKTFESPIRMILISVVMVLAIVAVASRPMNFITRRIFLLPALR